MIVRACFGNQEIGTGHANIGALELVAQNAARFLEQAFGFIKFRGLPADGYGSSESPHAPDPCSDEPLAQ